MNYTKIEIEEARSELLNILRKGDTIYTILRHVSTSGMSRDISVFVLLAGEPRCIDWQVARVLGCPLDKNGDIKVRGLGMNVGFHLIVNLGYALFGTEGDSLHHFNHRWL